jgi:hypothetical protein
MRAAVVLAALTAALAAAAPAAAAPHITVSPNPVDRNAEQTVRGHGWPVIEFCSRAVRLTVRFGQNQVTIGTARVRVSGRFRFTWSPMNANVPRGRWRLRARMPCESGDDGSPNPVIRSVPIRVR